MTDAMKRNNNGRRSFFLRGGAALGAGLAATTAGAAPFVFDETAPLKEEVARLQRELGALEDREALRQLRLTYQALMEKQAYEAALALFTEDARVVVNGEDFSGREQGVRELLVAGYGSRQAPEIPTAYRPEPLAPTETLTLSADRQGGRTSFHARVRQSRPVAGRTSLETMARLQGQSEETRWESARFDLDCVKEADTWKIRRLDYRPVV